MRFSSDQEHKEAYIKWKKELEKGKIKPIATTVQPTVAAQAATPPVPVVPVASIDKKPFWEYPIASDVNETHEPPEWAEEILNRLNGLQEQVDNGIPSMTQTPAKETFQQPRQNHIIQSISSIQPRTDDENFFIEFLQLHDFPQNFIIQQLRRMRMKGGALPDPGELKNCILGWNKNFKNAEYVANNYMWELQSRLSAKIPTANTTINPGQQQMSVNRQQPQQQPQYVPTFQQQLLEFFNLADRVNIMRNPDSQQSTSENIAQHISAIFDKRELDDYRSGKNRSLTETDVNMQEVQEKYKLENKKMSDKKESTQNWQDLAKNILSPIVPAILKTADELTQEQQAPPMQQGVKMMKGSCPQCGNEITFPSDSEFVICKCGKRCEVIIPEQPLPQENWMDKTQNNLPSVEKPYIPPVTSEEPVNGPKIPPVETEQTPVGPPVWRRGDPANKRVPPVESKPSVESLPPVPPETFPEDKPATTGIVEGITETGREGINKETGQMDDETQIHNDEGMQAGAPTIHADEGMHPESENSVDNIIPTKINNDETKKDKPDGKTSTESNTSKSDDSFESITTKSKKKKKQKLKVKHNG